MKYSLSWATRPVGIAVLLLSFAAGVGCGESDQGEPPTAPPAGDPGAATTAVPTTTTTTTTVPTTTTTVPTTTAVPPTTTSDAGTTTVPPTTSDAGATTADAGAPDAARAVPTWTQIYTTLFANPASPSSCAGASCHDPGRQRSVDFSSAASGYRTLRSWLVPGSPSTSRLVTDLQSGRMPDGRPRFSAADVDLVRAWIAAGALDN